MNSDTLRRLLEGAKVRLQGSGVGQRGWRLFLLGVFAYGAVSNIPRYYRDYKLKKLQADVDLYKSMSGVGKTQSGENSKGAENKP